MPDLQAVGRLHLTVTEAACQPHGWTIMRKASMAQVPYQPIWSILSTRTLTFQLPQTRVLIQLFSSYQPEGSLVWNRDAL